MHLKPTKVITHVKDPVGLGDLVAKVAQPIARAIDRVAGTNIAECSGCTGKGGRKDKLNAAMPNVLHPFRK